MFNLYRKLLAVQRQAITIHKNASATISGRQYRYADLPSVLEAIKPVLSENGLVITQAIDGDELLTRIVDADSGDAIESRFPLRLDGATWHQTGAAVAYARRYALTSLLGLAAEDDDDAVSTIPVRNETRANGHGETVPPCPDCGQPGIVSKFRKGEHYCGRCRRSYAMENAR